jgi:hypothetical protein
MFPKKGGKHDPIWMWLLAPFLCFRTMNSTLPKGFVDSDTFSCWVPAQAVVVKGGDKGGDKSGKRWIQGVASTGVKDLQGEIVEQDGIDFNYFLKHGYFNNDHKPGFENKVGQPTECRLSKQGLWVKGFLFNDNKVADSIWELINSLDASGSTRRVGFSIQGKVQRRTSSNIQKCWIQDVAITPAPVNHTTWCEIAKSLSAQAWDLTKPGDNNEDNDKTKEKALTAQGSPLVPESLHSKEAEDRTSKSLTFDEAVESIIKSKGVPKDAAESIAKIAFSIFS